MTITYALFVYLLPLAALCFGLLAMRDYGYPCLLRILACWLLREADRSERAQARHHAEIRTRLEDVA